MRQVGYLQRLYRDARSTEHKMSDDVLIEKPKSVMWIFVSCVVRDGLLNMRKCSLRGFRQAKFIQ